MGNDYPFEESTSGEADKKNLFLVHSSFVVTEEIEELKHRFTLYTPRDAHS